MELHHKLRRDPNWHPNACNICGQMGHQASTCPNGTVDWKDKYGNDAFQLRINQDPKDFRDPTPAEWSGMMQDLDKKSKEFIKMRTEALEKVNFEEISQKVAEVLQQAEAQMGISFTPAAAAPPAAEAPKDDLPPGWAAAVDAQGRTYYWFKKTQKVQWEKPTLESDTGE
mmetsp:Transcript_28702/g.80798  ORF Transcript_28702/g.80798 Transcript_28702/m.80798 type:complete len:170 (+) Transcript_28702:147-656(+)|eukprot:CAMPEP_0117655584 /NCGR_PEP_ID=MMETSP0804-20121206/4355_1 /TAXON_ID=1074897 /ORGANISM="Tetraselmis astigmatica, Strain CCMP880" /LENGTH=169 /DNA_ID=CAMNT_0005461941 /DNA_START=120 /DNA_END=629 /DNA_ORIENTATION=-